LNAQARGQAVAQRNAQDGISMLQTAEGALNEFTNVVLRMKDLAIQSANGTNTDDTERAALDAEYQQLAAELTNIMTNTSYGADNKLLDATDGLLATGAVTLQIGASDAETMEVDVQTALGDIDVTALGDLTTQGNSTTDIGALAPIPTAAGAARGAMSAYTNRPNGTVKRQANMSATTTAAMGRIMDTDVAAESATMT